MIVRDDTIAALSTATGRGAIAVIRVSGPAAHAMAATLCAPWPSEPRRVTRCRVIDPRDGSVIDDAMVTRFDAPASYTSEAMCELSCHGGLAVSTAVLDALVHLGARPAERGEFTQRAVLNGKLDLIRAEAIGDLVDARTQALRRLAVSQLDGGLSRSLTQLRDRIVHVEALLAYDIDFPEEDDGPIGRSTVVDAAREACTAVERLLSTAPLGEIARDGAVVVIAGPPNAGKSSLFNALLGEGRAIVTDVPGTTRDAIEARVESGRWPLRLIDTAGLRDTTDVVERLGIEVSERWLRAAQVVLVCGETDDVLREAIQRLARVGNIPRIAVRTKHDLRVDASPLATALDPMEGAEATVSVSAATRDGLGALMEHVHALLERYVGDVNPELPVVTRTRHREALERARSELTQFTDAWRAGTLPATVAAVHVRDAAAALDELIGTIDVEDVLDRVFRTFCVGK